MAKAFIYGNRRFWALTEAEDHIFIAAYLQVKSSIPTDDVTFAEHLHIYFDLGKMLADGGLSNLNKHLRAQGLEEIVLTAGYSDSHTILRGLEKVQRRREIREKLESLTLDERESLLSAKRAEILAQVSAPEHEQRLFSAETEIDLSEIERVLQSRSARHAVVSVSLDEHRLVEAEVTQLRSEMTVLKRLVYQMAQS
ncbi:MAG TPA: hypothetical protein VGU45_07865 [Microvirga sp.]|jgi:hypothetical protein|nr:hypothetical protein [Microvirga sp.]